MDYHTQKILELHIIKIKRKLENITSQHYHLITLDM